MRSYSKPVAGFTEHRAPSGDRRRGFGFNVRRTETASHRQFWKPERLGKPNDDLKGPRETVDSEHLAPDVIVNSHQFNTRPRPAEVFLDGENARLIRKREIVEDLFKGCDV